MKIVIVNGSNRKNGATASILNEIYQYLRVQEDAAGDYRFPLEMLRLAPSVVNKQPWRVVVTDQAVHFFKKNSLGTVAGSVDMQRIDVGIAICHFDLAVQERNMTGHFERQVPNIVIPEGMTYVIFWIKE